MPREFTVFHSPWKFVHLNHRPYPLKTDTGEISNQVALGGNKQKTKTKYRFETLLNVLRITRK